MTQRGLTIRVDQSDIRRVIEDLQNIRNGAPKALRSSVNRTLQGVRTSMARETAKYLALPQRRIKRDIHITKKATGRDPSGVVTSRGKPVSLHSFKAVQRKHGVSVKVTKREGRKTIQGAFIAEGKHGNRMVFWRKKTADNAQHIGSRRKKPWMAYARLPKKYRYPIEALHGPRAQDYTAQPEVMQKVEEEGIVRLKKELASQVNRLLNQQKT